MLAKFLFPKDKLSIQVHPDDAFACKYEQAAGGRGKTEMWHIVSAEPGAELLIGLKPGVTRRIFSKEWRIKLSKNFFCVIQCTPAKRISSKRERNTPFCQA